MDIMTCKPNLYAAPRKFWNKLEEGRELVRKGELTENQLKGWYLNGMDFYGGIKEAERWWVDDAVIDKKPLIEAGFEKPPKPARQKVDPKVLLAGINIK